MYPLLKIFTLTLTLSACSSTFKLPANRFESPEVQGERYRGNVSALSTGSANLSVTPDFGTTAPDTSSPEFDRKYLTPGGSINLGVLDRADLTLHGYDGSIGLLSFKYQFYGASAREATTGNLSFSMTAGIGYAEVNPTQTLEDGTLVSFKMVKEAFDLGAIAGYRFSPFVMAYISVFGTLFPFFGEWNDGNSVVPEVFSGEAQRIGTAFGLEFRFLQRGIFRVEASYSRMTSEQVFVDWVYPGFQLGIAW